MLHKLSTRTGGSGPRLHTFKERVLMIYPAPPPRPDRCQRLPS
jgi:hypothetical protein